MPDTGKTGTDGTCHCRAELELDRKNSVVVSATSNACVTAQFHLSQAKELVPCL